MMGRQRIDTTITLSNDASVDLALVAGSMHVTTWNRDQARIVAEASAGRLQMDASSSHLDLHQRSDENGDAGSARYVVTLPAGVRLSLGSVSGTITASGTHGPVEVSSVSGDVTVSGTGRRLSVETVSGSVRVTGAGGDVRATTVSGGVTVTGVSGTVRSETVSGRVRVTGAAGDAAHLESVSGAIDYAGQLDSSGRYSFATHSGRVALRVPVATDAGIRVETFSGGVTNTVPGATRRPEQDPDDERTSYHYTLGRGGARVSIATFSGDVTITSQENQRP